VDRGRSFRLARDEELAAGLTRVAVGCAEAALERLRASGAGEADVAEAIHGARRDLKKLRTVLRLHRDALGRKRYERLNSRFRDAGRALSASRDAEVKLATLDSLVEREGLPGTEAVGTWRQILERDRVAAADSPAEARAVEQAINLIEAGREELDGWGLEGDRWKPVGAALERTYRRGRRAMRAAERTGSQSDFHEWRKRAKDLWYELRLFGPSWPAPLEAAAEEAHALSDHLGDHHDLALLRADLAGRNLGEREAVALDAAIARRQEELAAAALPLGRRLYAERPEDFSRRLRRYREAWRG
jgi:CHAD domain-containing protein